MNASALQAGLNWRNNRQNQQINREQMDLAMRQFAEQRDDESKRLAQTSKAAETFVKANPTVLTTLGMTDQEFANLSASEQIGVVDGYYKSQAMQEVLQQLAQRKTEMEQDRTFADTLQSRTRTSVNLPAQGSDPTGLMAFAGMPSRTATATRIPTRDDLLAAMAAAPMARPSRELMSHRLVQPEAGERNIQFQEDPVSGQRFATFGNMMQPSGVNPQAVQTTAPTISPDGKFFHNGKQWVALKQIGYPEGSTIVTENGQTVVKGPDGRILTPPRSGSPFAAMFGGAGEPETPAAAPAGAPGGAPAVITSQQQYDALPSGAEYQDSQGNIRRKK